MAEQLRVFVSHSHQDNDFCHAIVQALRDAGADVWYDEHNLGSGRLGPTIERELRDRPVFVVILSPSALQSQWVEDETRWAYGLQRKDTKRIIQPVVAATIAEDDIWLFLQDFKRIEADGRVPFTMREAASRLVHVLGLTPAGAALAPAAPQPAGDVNGLLERGKALFPQLRFAEALTLFEYAAHLAPNNAVVWATKGMALNGLRRPQESLSDCDHALSLDPNLAIAWFIKGTALVLLSRYEDALVAFDNGLALDPNDTAAWANKASALSHLGRRDEAIIATRRARELGEQR